MKDTERTRLLYQDSEAFKAGVEVGKKETIERAMKWLYAYYPTIERCDSAEDAWKYFEQAMLDPSLFPEVTFENSPMEVELVIKK